MNTELDAISSPLSAGQVERIGLAIADARSQNTRLAYASSMRSFRAWCEANAQPSLPTNPAVVSAYLVDLADVGRSLSTIELAVSAIGAAHRDAGHAADPCHHRGVRTVMQGLKRRYAGVPRRQAHALTVPELKRILGGIDRSTTAGRRDSAMLLLGLTLALRRSEICALRRSDITLSAEGVTARIVQSKGDQLGVGQTIGSPAGHGDTDVVAALRKWIAVSGGRGPDAGLFCRVDRNDVVLPGGLSPQSINAIFQKRCAAVGLDVPNLSVHGLRSGHIDAVLRGGASIESVQRVTRHKSVDTLLIYSRTLNAIADGSGAALGL